MSLKSDPSSEPLHISVKLFFYTCTPDTCAVSLNSEPETLNPTTLTARSVLASTRNPKSTTRNLKLETRNPTPEATPTPKSETRDGE